MIMNKKAMTVHTLLIVGATIVALFLIMMLIWAWSGHAPSIIEAPFNFIKGMLLGG